MATTERTINDAVGGVLLLATLFFVVVAWPVSPMLVACALGWWLARRRESPWRKVTRDMLLPVMVGLAALSVMLFVLNLSKLTLDPARLRAVEMFLVHLRMKLRGWTSLKWPFFVAIVAALTAITYFFPKLRLVTRFFWVQSAVSKILLVLMTLTTFTFFSQVPLESMAAAEHERTVQRYHILLRQESDAVAQYLSYETVERAIPTLNEADKKSFQLMFRGIESTSLAEVPKALRSSLKQSISESLARRSSRDALALPEITHYSSQFRSDEKAEPEMEKALDLMPVTAKGWENQLAVLREQESKSSAAELRAKETLAGLTKIFSETLGLAVPEFEGLAGAYLKGLASEYSETIFEKAVRKWRLRKESRSTSHENAGISLDGIESLMPHPDIVRLFLAPFPENAGSAARPAHGSGAEVSVGRATEIEARVREEIESLKGRERMTHNKALELKPGERIEDRARGRLAPLDRSAPRGR